MIVALNYTLEIKVVSCYHYSIRGIVYGNEIILKVKQAEKRNEK